jgi:transcription initiation factor TFIIE subunit alpha
LRKRQEEEEAKRRMQQECKIFVPDSQTERQVGKKYKRDDDDEGIEWEEHQPTGTGIFCLASTILSFLYSLSEMLV